ncbi:wax ester/triacylglycerol synthase domain-containing protein [Rhodococcus erythropolis]
MRLPSKFAVQLARLSPRDADFIYNEADGHLGHLIGVYFFDTSQRPESEFSREQAVEWVTARLGHHRMFTHKVGRIPLGLDHPYWMPVNDFDIRDHVHVTDLTEPGWASLEKPLSALMTSRMDLTRPPWELHFFNGIEGLDDLDGRLTAVVLKSHHSAADGIAIRMLGESIFSGEERAARHVPVPRLLKVRVLLESLASIPSQMFRFARSVPGNRAAQRSANAAQSAGEWVESLNERPATRFNGKVSGSGTLQQLTLPGAVIGGVKHAVPGATVNDVLLAIVGGALSRYLTENGEPPGGSLVAMVPRSMRKVEEWQSANQLVTLSVDMHTSVAAPLERLALIAQSSRSEKVRTSHPATRRVDAAIETAPAFLLRFIAFARSRNSHDVTRPRYQHTMVSNIPLSVEGLTLNGAPGAAVLATQPPVDGDGLRHFMVAAAGGGLTLNVIADTATMPDLHHYIELLRASFDDLAAAAAMQTADSPNQEVAS